ncbi:acyl-CoA dehydrogenase family protein [Paenacidovorax monticola]|uniref:Acyl-CoA/acyl-ACP dehydrogenase n=1 Tax=Paenacidovorax monticola TaxID=1926868 RepID=A0A7H0HD25_9BURK|nr:acyl-CoA dehydrogenase family protein [Paenacidovorax monticola]QNP58441.1 acyl-CoA/acyl-ACP dehydrogenase [Paenacidovorax monticola]
MDFALNEEQQMLQASARRFFADHHPLARARRALPWSDADQRRLWADMAGMGWLALLVPEAHGGLGLGMAEACLVAEEAGRQLVNLPLAASAVLLPQWLAACGEDAPEALRGWVQAAMAGERAFHSMAEGDAWTDHAGQASDCIVVQGWHDGSVPLRAALRPAGDGAVPGALDPTLLQAPATALAQPLDWITLPLAPEARARVRAAHRLALAAELVGVAQAALDLACAYARERVQFGKPIGSYQALKHQLANAWMGVDNARLALLYAAAAIDGGLPDWRFACAAAEYTAIEGAQHSTRTAIQVHGGMGFTWEHDAHLYLKRAQHLAVRLGGASRALDRVEALALA